MAHVPDPADGGVAIFLGKPESLGQVGADFVTVEDFDAMRALAQFFGGQIRERGFSRPGQACKPQGKPLIHRLKLMLLRIDYFEKYVSYLILLEETRTPNQGRVASLLGAEGRQVQVNCQRRGRAEDFSGAGREQSIAGAVGRGDSVESHVATLRRAQISIAVADERGIRSIE